nr:cytosolic phospholipase A2 gamma-like [Pelodiscus sinensis]XP_014424488.1 cytosolic phospholipase A2 gamma-like [Pelodiscus sinensis]|eukprot:XP_006114090.1 cytosolic phospholipase A2 gamma-like [Pelodiscus sinensis]
MSQPRADDGSVRFSPELSEGEKEATRSRKVKVLECLNKLGISCDEKTMPNIAVLGSGGGLRATIALLGTLAEMKKQGLLDAVMYLCGVSGSTWCISTLYNGKDWAKNIETLEEKLCNDLCWTPVDIQKQLDWVTKAADGEVFSLTDVWEAFVVKNILKLNRGKKLSEHKAAASNGMNPYPIYAAVEQNTFEKENTCPGTWFEFTPHECGFPGLDVFVSTKYFGSKFQGGKLTEPKEEKHMSYLQSLWGSALGSMQENKHYLMAHIKGLFERGPKPLDFTAVYGIFKNEWDRLGNSVDDYRSNPDNTVWTRFRSYFEAPLKALRFVTRRTNFIEKLKTCYDNWTWGITNNFLYQTGNVHADGLDKREVFNLIDAGVANNCAYPLVLRPARRVGLILSFDFCIDGSFETLKRASKYCEENQIPFPPIDPEVMKDLANPSSCYIFEGKGTPTVMHFPLFNTKNCPGPQEITKTRITFPTLRMSYTRQEMEELLNKAKMNVAENKDKILEQIQKIVSSPTRGF